MALTETRISQLINKALAIKVNYKQYYAYTRIESNITSQGIPDAVVCIGGKEIWLELKVWPKVPTPMQIGFAEARMKAGNNNCYLIQGIDDYECWYQFMMHYPNQPKTKMTYLDFATYLFDHSIYGR